MENPNLRWSVKQPQTAYAFNPNSIFCSGYGSLQRVSNFHLTTIIPVRQGHQTCAGKHDWQFLYSVVTLVEVHLFKGLYELNTPIITPKWNLISKHNTLTASHWIQYRTLYLEISYLHNYSHPWVNSFQKSLWQELQVWVLLGKFLQVLKHLVDPILYGRSPQAPSDWMGSVCVLTSSDISTDVLWGLILGSDLATQGQSDSYPKATPVLTQFSYNLQEVICLLLKVVSN